MITTDPTLLFMLFILPSLFGLTLIGEGVGKIMDYDRRGWVGVSAGSIFLAIITIAYFVLNSKITS